LGRLSVNGNQDSTFSISLGNDSSFRVGLCDNKVCVRISSEYDLSENRAHSPCEILGQEIANFSYAEDGVGNRLTSDTIFLSAEHTVVFLREIGSLNGRLMCDTLSREEEIEIELCTEDEKNEAIRDHDRYPYYIHCFPRVRIHSDRVMTITTFVRATGSNQMDMAQLENGSVTLTYDEWIKLSDCRKYYAERILEILYSHANISDLIMTRAGECISSMVRTKIGPFEIGKMNTFDREQLLRAFMEAYSEFCSFNYCKSLHNEISRKVQERKLDIHNISLTHLINNVLSQINILSSSRYLK